MSSQFPLKRDTRTLTVHNVQICIELLFPYKLDGINITVSLQYANQEHSVAISIDKIRERTEHESHKSDDYHLLLSMLYECNKWL